MIQANCRSRLTADDFSFIVRVLSKSPRDAVSLVSLLSDEAERDAILDHDLLYASLVDELGCLRVSPALYFYVLTRRVLRRAALDERALTDYVAAVLLAFSHTNQLHAAGTPSASRSFPYVSDLLARLGGCAPGETYLLRTHLADYALFLCGLFAGRVEAHAQRRGAPGLDFYEAVGQASYLDASRHPQARRADLGRIFEMLGGEFRRVRLALNDLTDTLLHLHVAPAASLIRPP